MTEEELKQKAEEYLHKDGTESEKLVKDIGMLCLTKKQLNGIFAIFKQIYIDSAEPREKRIAELEKENAELKAFRQDCVKLTEDNVVIVRQRAETSKQLTKATELLRKLVLEVKGYEEIYGYDTCEPVQEAEQFLSEVEK